MATAYSAKLTTREEAPTTIFNKETGSLFWPDVPDHTTGPWYLSEDAWELMGLPFRHERQFESGQLVIDKRRCWRPMQLTMHLNEHSGYYYSVFYGDKDTLRLAWRKVAQLRHLVYFGPLLFWLSVLTLQLVAPKHNGWRSIIQRLGSPDFVRVRVGIGKPPAGFRGGGADWVLSAFDALERAELPDIVARAVEALKTPPEHFDGVIDLTSK